MALTANERAARINRWTEIDSLPGCQDCVEHQGWSSADVLKRRQPADYCARCLGTGVDPEPAIMVEIEDRTNGYADVEITIGSGDNTISVGLEVDDCEPDDVVGPIVSRAVEEAFAESHLLCNFRIVGWHEPRPNTFSITETEEV